MAFWDKPLAWIKKKAEDVLGGVGRFAKGAVRTVSKIAPKVAQQALPAAVPAAGLAGIVDRMRREIPDIDLGLGKNSVATQQITPVGEVQNAILERERYLDSLKGTSLGGNWFPAKGNVAEPVTHEDTGGTPYNKNVPNPSPGPPPNPPDGPINNVGHIVPKSPGVPRGGGGEIFAHQRLYKNPDGWWSPLPSPRDRIMITPWADREMLRGNYRIISPFYDL